MSSDCRTSLYCMLLSFILLMTMQTIFFQKYSSEATWIYVKEFTGSQNTLDRKRLAGICNSLNRVKCSVRMFRQLVQDLPGDSAMLSNLAMSLTQLSKEHEAFPYFSAYFSTGGSAKDVMLSYAKALRHVGKTSDSLHWLYQIIYEDPHDIHAARELISALVDLDRGTEALSFLASLIDHNRNDETSELWFSELKKMDPQTRDIANVRASTAGHDPQREQDEMAGTSRSTLIKLPALDGRRFFIPFRTVNGDYQFIVTSREEEDFLINTQDFSQMGWDHEVLSTKVVHVSKASIGNIDIRDFNLKLCGDCESKVGSQFLGKLGAYVDARSKIPYLILEEKERE